MSLGGLNSNYTGAGIAGKHESEVRGQPGLVAERFLDDGVEHVISQSGTELLVRISGGEFNVEAGSKGWREGPRRLAEIPLYAEVRVADAAHALRFGRSVNGKVGNIDIPFEVKRQPIIE